jgi:hypothetical protein
MKKPCIITTLSFIIAAIVIVACVSLIVIAAITGDSQREKLVSGDDGAAYNMDSQTILLSIAEGKSDMFVQQAGTPTSTPIQFPHVQWKQADYLKVADAFSKAIFHESLDGWKVKDDIFFKLDCKDASFGPQYAFFTFFKTVNIGQDTSRIEHTIIIEPQKNQVTWTGSTYSPDYGEAVSIDLSRVKFPVDEALRIAEENGGDKARLGVNNICQIDIYVAGGGFWNTAWNNWDLGYTGYHGDNLLEMDVSTQTGNYQIIYPKPK